MLAEKCFKLMNDLKVYWTSIEYTYGKKNRETKQLAGGFVYGFVKAVDVREAIEKFILELKDQNLNVKSIEFVSPYEKDMEWDAQETKEKYIQLYNEAELKNEVILDDFYAYERE